jgi:Right handed beta helix region
MRTLPVSLSLTAILFTAAAQLNAQASRTWVSGVGDDANPCSRTAPCKTFAGAISKTAAGGEIDVLDPGGFGAVTITKSITISSIGFEAGVLVTGTDGIVIAAGSTDTVWLRGLDIYSIATAPLTDNRGIKFLSGAVLTVENCTITGFPKRGISIESSTPGAKAFITNTLVIDQTNNGIVVDPPSVTNTAVLDHVRVVNSAALGLGVNPGSLVYVKNSDFSHNVSAGVFATGNAKVTLDSNLISNNGVGLSLTSGALARLSNNDVVGNTVGFDTAGGILNSFGDNHTTGNTDNVQPTVNNHFSPL